MDRNVDSGILKLGIGALMMYFIAKCVYLALTVQAGIPPDEHTHLQLITAFADTGSVLIDPLVFGPSQEAAMSQDSFLFHLILAYLERYLNVFSSELMFLRSVNILLAVLNCVFFFKILRLVFKSNWLPFLGMAIYTNILMFTFLSASVNYDNLANLMATAVVYFLIAYHKSRQVHRLLWISILLSLGVLVKSSIWPLVPVALAWLIYSHHNDSRPIFVNVRSYWTKQVINKVLIFASLASISFSGLVLVKNQLHYGEFITINCSDVYDQEQCLASNGLTKRYADLEQKNQGLKRRSLLKYYDDWVDLMMERTFGIAAAKFMFLSDWENDLLKIILIVPLFVLFRRHPREMQMLLTISAFYIAVLFLYVNYQGYLRHGEMDAGLQGRYLFPVLSCLVIYLLYAYDQIFKHPVTKKIVLSALAVFFVYLDFPAYSLDANRPLFSIGPNDPVELPEMPLTEDTTGTILFIDLYNDVLIEDQEERIDLAQVHESLVLSGWAFDNYRQKPANQLVFTVNTSGPFKAVYGLERPDIARVFENNELALTGFEIRIPVDLLQGATNVVEIFVLNDEGRVYRDSRVLKIGGRQ